MSLTVLVVSRDVFLITGMIIIFVMSNQFDAKTNFLGKITTVCQMFLIGAVLSGCGLLVKNTLVAATAGFTLISGASYLRAGVRVLSNGGSDAV